MDHLEIGIGIEIEIGIEINLLASSKQPHFDPEFDFDFDLDISPRQPAGMAGSIHGSALQPAAGRTHES